MIALMLAVLCFAAPASASETAQPAPAQNEVVVGTTTKVSGDFFTGLFSNNTSDIDVRTLVYGYAPAVWETQWSFVLDKTVVKTMEVKKQPKWTDYIVTIKDGLTYNDGKTPVKAQDYVFSMLLQLSPALKAFGANAEKYRYVAGYDEYLAGDSMTLEGVTLLDEDTFILSVKSAYLPYFYELSYLNFYPYPMGVLAPGLTIRKEAHGAALYDEKGEIAALSEDTLLKTVAGDTGYQSFPALTAGPWKLTAYDREKGEVAFEKNPYYKGNFEGQTPSIERLRLLPVYQDTMAEDLASGRLTVINKLSDGEVIENLLEDNRLRHEMYPRIGYGFIAFNQAEGRPFADVRLRRALSCALQKEKLAQDFTRGFGRAVYGYYGIGQWEVLAVEGSLKPGMMGVKSLRWPAAGESKLEKYPYSLENANALLDKAGWQYNSEGKPFVPGQDSVRFRKAGDGLEPLKVTFLASENNAAVTLLLEQLEAVKRQTGMDIAVDTVPFTQLLNAYYQTPDRKGYDFTFLATNFLSSFDPSRDFSTAEAALGSVNSAGYQQEKLEKLAQDMRRTKPMQFSEYLGEWQRFQEQYARDLPTLPLYSNNYFDFHQPDLQNYRPDKRSSWPVAMLYAVMQ